MTKKMPVWAREIGYQAKIKPHNPNFPLNKYGLAGEKADGKLPFDREKIRKSAREDAQDGLPVSEASTPDQWSECEQDIAAEAEEVRLSLKSWFAASSASVRNFLQDCTPAPVNSEVLQESIKAEQGSNIPYDEDDHQEASALHQDLSDELKAFRQTHGDRIGKRTPDIKKNIEQTIAILLFVMILEGGFNALLFKDAQSNGLLGGLLVAFAVSAVNVGCGVTAGFFGLRYLNHPSTLFKALGAGVATFFVLFGMFLNLYVAHFRDAVEHALNSRMADGSLAGFSMFDLSPGSVIVGMFPNIIGLDSMVAFGLLFMGLTIFCVSVYEGYDKISDRYPGYGRVWRKERQAYERKQEIKLATSEDLGAYFTSSRSWFDQQLTRHVEARREIEKAINWLEVRREEAMAIAAKCGEQERNLKVTYRQAHRRERNNHREDLGPQSECPAYFNEIVVSNVPEFSYDKERSQADAAVTVIDQNITELTRSRKWLDQHIQASQPNNNVHRLTPPSTQISEGGRGPDRKTA